MGGIFSRPKKVKAPPVPEPEPVPEEIMSSEVPELVKEEEARKRRRRRGRRKTVVTGELEPESVGKRTLLG